MASLISKSKALGEIGPIATGDAKLYVDGFKAGAMAADPEAAVHVSYTGSFSDPSLMSKQASEYLAQKVDVLTGSSQSVVGAITVAKANNVAWFGTQWSQASLAPKQVVSSQVYDWTGTLTSILNGVKAGKLGGSSFAITLKNGGEKIQYNPGYTLAGLGQDSGREGSHRDRERLGQGSRMNVRVSVDRLNTVEAITPGTAPETAAPLLEMRGITKRFPE